MDDVVRQEGRASRWRRRAQVQKISSIGRVRRCGMERDPDAGTVLAVTERPAGRRAGVEGLVTCGSVWACPVCATKVAAKRAEELAHVLDAVHTAGGSAFMWTGTIRHTAGDRLGLSREERERRYVLDRRRKWGNRLDKIDQRRCEREVAEAKGWDVDEHQAEADDITETSIRREIAEQDPQFLAVGPAAREWRRGPTARARSKRPRPAPSTRRSWRSPGATTAGCASTTYATPTRRGWSTTGSRRTWSSA